MNGENESRTYFAIGEVAARFGVAESLLRYWEKEFPSIKPRKGGRGVRMYTQSDVDEISLVYNLVKVRGMKLSAARETIRKNREGSATTADVIARLQSIRRDLVELKSALNALS